MAQAFIDHQVIEVIGDSTTFKYAQIEHIVMEVLGFFKFGFIEVDHIVAEVIGATPEFSVAQITHFNLECIGQWAGF